MPADLLGEVAGGLLRALGRIVIEIVVQGIGEFLIQGTGYLLCRPFKPNVKPDGVLVGIVGLAFWMLLGVFFYFAFFRSIEGTGT